jgi:polyhydroxyalkanoate synthesis regulator phasin
MIIDDLRRTVEGLVGTLTPARAQQLAKDMLEPGAAKEQVAKTTADLLEWSQGNRERISVFVRREISEQLKAVGGVASQSELDALKKRVRDLERAAGMTASGRVKATGSTAKKRTTSSAKSAAKKTTASKRSSTSTPTTGG